MPRLRRFTPTGVLIEFDQAPRGIETRGIGQPMQAHLNRHTDVALPAVMHKQRDTAKSSRRDISPYKPSTRRKPMHLPFAGYDPNENLDW